MKCPFSFLAQMPLAVISVLLLLLFPSTTAHGQTYIFGRADFPVGHSAVAIAAGDFNGDGLTDFAVANYADSTVSVLLGRADGTLAPQVTYPTGSGPVAIAAADFDGDGRVDLAVANANCPDAEKCTSSTVSILLGNGDGTFQPHIDFAVGPVPSSVVAADFNGDGKVDLAVANTYDGTVSVLLGNGDGTFQPQTTYDTAATTTAQSGPNLSWQSLVVGDFNNDGKLDLAVTCSSVISVLLGNGNGTFQPHIDSGVGGFFLAAGDFNGDGKLDLAVDGVSGNMGPTLSVLLGLGNGTFVLQSQYESGNSATAPAVADLNGDGKLDVLVPVNFLPDGFEGVAIFLGNGDGSFQPAVDYGTAIAPSSLWVADLNGDGKLDLAVVTTSGCSSILPPALACAGGQISGPGPGSISVLFGFGDGTFVGKTDYPTDQLNGGWAVASADFNNDGKLDLASANGSANSVSVLLGNGDGTFQAPVSYPVGQTPVSLAAGDFANNGNVDLVTANSNCTTTPCGPGSVSVLLGNGNGTFQPHTDYAAGLEPTSVAVGDFRSNGKLDLAVTNSGSSSVSILLGNGDGTFQPQVSYLTASTESNVEGTPQLIAIGDFNQDGKPDLAVVTLEAVSILLGNGDGTFQSHVDIPIGVYAIATADFNGDGKLDLALSSPGGVLILLGNGNGTFQAPVKYASAYSSGGSSIVVTDFNGDGKLDLAVDSGGPESFIFLGNGNGTFRQPIAYLAANAYSPSLTVGDFNGDGIPDWAVGDPVTIDVMLSTAFKAVAPASLNFGFHGTGTTSNPQTITISNPSNVKINVASITSSGTFSQTNDCGVSLIPGASCQVSVTFSPTTTGSQSGNITIADSTRISPLAIALSGTGVNGPYLTSYPSQLNFSPQAIGVSSSPAAIVMENTGNASLNVTGISITGINSSDFTQTNNCGGPLAPAGTCTANVRFKPTAGGFRMADLSVMDTAPGSPQAVALTGTGVAPGFTLSLAPGSPSSKTVNPGQSATFTLSLAPSGSFSGVVNLKCSITPAVTSSPTCTLSNSSVQISPGTVQSITVTVGTTAPVSSGAISERDLRPGPPLLVWFSMILGTGCLLLGYRTRRSRVGPLAVALALATLVGCGSSSTQTVAGTPSGTYTVAIAATSGSIAQMMPLQVVVY